MKKLIVDFYNCVKAPKTVNTTTH